jgi:hypothetical protein
MPFIRKVFVLIISIDSDMLQFCWTVPEHYYKRCDGFCLCVSRITEALVDTLSQFKSETIFDFVL